MLTAARLAILIKYHWDLRGFRKHGAAAEQALMAEVDWHQLAEILQDLKLYHQNLLSPDYARTMHAALLAVCADEETAQMFIGYASTF